MTVIHKEPVVFHCIECDSDWQVPPNTNCPRCGPGPICIVPKEVWTVSWLEDYPVSISGNLRDYAHFFHILIDERVDAILDVANDPHCRIVWRPPSEAWNALGIDYRAVWGIKDMAKNSSIDPDKIEQAINELDRMVADGRRVLIHCAAGLRRAPHLVYAWLRSHGHDPVAAWDQVEKARPWVFMDTGFVDSIESWLPERNTRAGR